MKNFKRVIIALMVILAASGVAEAKIIGFGIKAGVNVNKLSFNKDLMKADNSVGWTAGVMADVNIPLLGFGVDASLMYARMNNSSDPTLSIANAPVLKGDSKAYGQNFLEIPVNLKYTFSLPVVGRILKPYIFTGPNFAFCLDKQQDTDLTGIKSKTFQMAWNVGLGVMLVSHVQIGASYGFGCNNIIEKTGIVDAAQLSDLKVKNNYWTVTAAYVF